MKVKEKVGVLVVNLGTPDAPTTSAVRRYLKQFLLDARVIDYPWLPRNLLVRGLIAPFRAKSSAKLYQRLWTENGSPLKTYGEILVDEIQKKLESNYHVRLAMRYQNPSIERQLEDLIQNVKVDRLIVLPLFPQYASATTGSIIEEVMRLLSKKLTIPAVNFINSYPLDEKMIKVFADNAREMKYKEYDHIVFSYHGVPARQIRNSDTHSYCKIDGQCCETLNDNNKFCYSAQCNATSRAIAAELGLERRHYTVCFQSRLGPEEWLKPYTIDTIKQLPKDGKKKVLVFSPAFVADCLETIVEIGYEYKEEFEHEFGGDSLDLVPSLNDDPRWVESLADIIKLNS